MSHSWKIVGASVLAAAIAAWLILRPQSQPPAPDLMAPESYARLLSIPLDFDGDFGPGNRPRQFGFSGNGEHADSVPAVTPHPSSPAFGAGVKVVMTNEEFRQFFLAYQTPKHPVFVTSDSLLQGYLGVLRDTLLRAEAVQAWRLRDALRNGLPMIEKVEVKGDAKLISAARRLARLNVAITLRLLDPYVSPLPSEDEEAIVKKEVARIENGEGRHWPEWLHEPSKDLLAIDYRAFRPVGARNSRIEQRRFHAIKWLQVVPWRLDQDVQLLATLIASRVTSAAHGGSALRDGVGMLLLPPDDVDAEQINEWNGADGLALANLPHIREKAMNRLGTDPPRLNDGLRQSTPGSGPLTCRWRSAGRASDLVALREAFGDRPKNGLALCACLGSPFAQSRQESGEWAKATALDVGDRLTHAYWHTIAALFASAPKGAPEFMNQVEWQIKSCQAALAGWVQWRHAIELFGKSDSEALNGGPPKLRGAVEPNPEFFRRLAALANRTAEDLKRQGLLDSTPRHCASLIPEMLEALSERKAAAERKAPSFGTYYRRSQITEDLWFRVYPKGSKSSMNQYETAAAALVQFYDAASKDQWPSDPVAHKLLEAMDEPTARRLKVVANLANRCAELADKEIAGQPFTEEDDGWFIQYGQQLAGLAGYQRDADATPEDDAPMTTEIGYEPTTDVFHAGAVGRPRALWVLYPYQGTEVLCRGAVYPYYEFDSKEKPSDDAWQQQVRAGKQPPQPDWIKPLLREGTPEKKTAK